MLGYFSLWENPFKEKQMVQNTTTIEKPEEKKKPIEEKQTIEEEITEQNEIELKEESHEPHEPYFGKVNQVLEKKC